MQTFWRYKLPALLLAGLIFTAAVGYCQTASSAAIQATATVAAPFGMISVDESSTVRQNLTVVYPAYAHVIVSTCGGSAPIDSNASAELSSPVSDNTNRSTVRYLDCGRLLTTDSPGVVTIIFCEN